MAAKKKTKKPAPKKAAKKSAPKAAAKTAKPNSKLKLKTKQKQKPNPKTKPTMAAKAAEPKALKTLSPLDDRIVVALDQAEEKTAGGLFIPGTATGQQQNRGTVVAVGPGRRNKKGQLRPLDVQVGDRVMFAEYSGTKITVGSGEALILREDEVLGIET